MTSIAVDPVDANWRLFQQTGEKGLTVRAYRLIRRNARRARGDRCHCHAPHGEGRRIIALERVTRTEVEQELDDPASAGLEPLLIPIVEVNDLSEEDRRDLDLVELLDPVVREHALMLNIADQQRHQKEGYDDPYKYRRFLRDLIESLEQRVAKGATAATERFLDECRLELYALESVLYAA